MPSNADQDDVLELAGTYGLRRVEVYCARCCQWSDEHDVQFENVEEDFQGRDLVEFICPHCHTHQKSVRILK